MSGRGRGRGSGQNDLLAQIATVLINMNENLQHLNQNATSSPSSQPLVPHGPSEYREYILQNFYAEQRLQVLIKKPSFLWRIAPLVYQHLKCCGAHIFAAYLSLFSYIIFVSQVYTNQEQSPTKNLQKGSHQVALELVSCLVSSNISWKKHKSIVFLSS
ncbi:hypothetical protein Lal_00022810 [Lupinus albus]|nr:hypothetical protein Lal_00022810 [Lupinus albus]